MGLTEPLDGVESETKNKWLVQYKLLVHDNCTLLLLLAQSPCNAMHAVHLKCHIYLLISHDKAHYGAHESWHEQVIAHQLLTQLIQVATTLLQG